MHQWLVEMLRRVNLPFAIYDESRCEAIEKSEGLQDDETSDASAVNPFENDQLVLCSIDFLSKSENASSTKLQDGDLLVVDKPITLRGQVRLPLPNTCVWKRW